MFAFSGAIAAFVLKSDAERLVIPMAVGIGALLLGVLFVESFMRGLTGLEDFTRMGISSALNMLIAISYGAGTLLSGLISFGLGKLVSRGEVPTETTTFVTPTTPVRTKPQEEKPPAKEVSEKVAAQPKTAEIAPTATAAAESEAGQPVKAISASEKIETVAPEEVVKQVEPAVTTAEALKLGEAVLTPSEVELELAEKEERAKKVKELLVALEAPLEKIASKIEKEPGAVWRPIPCPTCGSELTWSRERQAYVCPYCGTVP
jgi:hypothetical protein